MTPRPGRWAGCSAPRPLPFGAPADTGANTITKLVTMALWCRTYPVPAGFDAALAAARDASVVTVTAAAGATQLLVDQGCRSAQDLRAVRRALAVRLATLVRRMPVGDASLQAATMLFALGRRDLVPSNWHRRVVDAQRPDGSWPAGAAPGSSRQAWRATVWAVRALVAAERGGRAPRLAPPASESTAPSTTATTTPPPPKGTVRPEDLRALDDLAVHGSRSIGEPSGGTPFGTHPVGHHEAAGTEEPAVVATRTTQLDAATQAAGALGTIVDAAAAGYVLGSAFIPGVGAHWIKWDLVDRPFDPARPSMLLFDGNGADAALVGFSYVVRSRGAPPDGFAGGADPWHQHYAICFANGRLVGSDILSTGDCRVLGLMTSATPATLTSDLLTGRDLWMLHAWVVPGHANPDGVFAPTNGAVQCATCPPWLAGNELS